MQFLILSIIGGREKSGREIRGELARRNVRKSGPAFYQLMARLEDDRMVSGWYEQKIVDSQVIKERRYRLLAPGVRAVNDTKEFYEMLAASNHKTGGLAHA
jgi:hypothetical protein